MPVLESYVERTAVQRLKSLGIECLKFTPDGIAGYPDRIVVLPKGRIAWLEFKRPGETPTPLQDRRMKDLEKCGHHVGWFDTVEDAVRWVTLLHYEIVRGDI